MVLTSQEKNEPYMACSFDREGTHYLDRNHELDSHIRLCRHLTDMALSPAESVELIQTVIRERYT